ncbi:MAG: replication factor C large subunit [Bacteroidales bacterium]|nr:replication factor C large subunit [Bacteroidales bacterium]
MMLSENIPWSEKYRVEKLDDVKGQDLAIDKIKVFLRGFPKKRAIILHGPAGVGKTSLAYAVAGEMGAEILELNASDFRNKDKIMGIVGPASQQASLFGEGKVILIDEVDGISAMKDRGGLVTLLGLIAKSAFPVVITANDIWDKKFSGLRKKCEVVDLREVDYLEILKILMEVCEKENCVISGEVLRGVAIRAKGDIRAALNDLEILSKMDADGLSREVGDRDKERSVFDALAKVFGDSRIGEDMIKVYDDVNMPIDDLFLWVEENLPVAYQGEELCLALDRLSLADVYRGRIRRQRHYRFMVYEYFLLGAGIASVKKYDKGGFVKYKKPSRILKIWLQNQRAAKKKSICEKYARVAHVSVRRAMRDFLLLRIILGNDKIRRELDLSSDEIAYLDQV